MRNHLISFHVLAFQEMLAPMCLCYLTYGGSVSSSDYSICDEYKTPWAMLAAKTAVYRTLDKAPYRFLFRFSQVTHITMQSTSS